MLWLTDVPKLLFPQAFDSVQCRAYKLANMSAMPSLGDVKALLSAHDMDLAAKHVSLSSCWQHNWPDLYYSTWLICAGCHSLHHGDMASDSVSMSLI